MGIWFFRLWLTRTYSSLRSTFRPRITDSDCWLKPRRETVSPDRRLYNIMMVEINLGGNKIVDLSFSEVLCLTLGSETCWMCWIRSDYPLRAYKVYKVDARLKGCFLPCHWSYWLQVDLSRTSLASMDAWSRTFSPPSWPRLFPLPLNLSLDTWTASRVLVSLILGMSAWSYYRCLGISPSTTSVAHASESLYLMLQWVPRCCTSGRRSCNHSPLLYLKSGRQSS